MSATHTTAQLMELKIKAVRVTCEPPIAALATDREVDNQSSLP